MIQRFDVHQALRFASSGNKTSIETHCLLIPDHGITAYRHRDKMQQWEADGSTPCRSFIRNPQCLVLSQNLFHRLTSVHKT